ncbi:MAG: hypothetical protein AABO58_22300 [Acidobacteriota bacterium]
MRNKYNLTVGLGPLGKFIYTHWEGPRVLPADEVAEPVLLRVWVLWVLLFAVSWFARGFFVQFIGDVAAYVEPHRVDKFNDLRDRIKSCVFETSEAIYRMTDSAGVLRYDRVAIVAHSLGSVIAYDTLNALIRSDHASKLEITARTTALITFGSPLDKIAYVFGLQRATDTQDALAATVQPLIQDVRHRPTWINIHSANDIISGGLDYYGGAGLTNVPDPDATIPLAAHVEYWENPTLWGYVVGAI